MADSRFAHRSVRTTHTSDLGLRGQLLAGAQTTPEISTYVTWGEEFGDSPFFEGEVEPCINGRVLASGAYFGEPSDRLLDRLLSEQLEDGGWNCEAPPSVRSSFDTTICVLEGLLEYERARGATAAVTGARVRGQQYLLERRMFRRLSTGDVVDPSYTQFSFPPRWYDVFRGLDYLRSAGVEPDDRGSEAVDLVEGKRRGDGRWPLDDPYPVGSTSTWKTGRATPAAGTPSAPCECWTGIATERARGAAGGRQDVRARRARVIDLRHRIGHARRRCLRGRVLDLDVA